MNVTAPVMLSILTIKFKVLLPLGSNNFLQIELFYKELTERKVSQQKAYEYQSLLSEYSQHVRT